MARPRPDTFLTVPLRLSTFLVFYLFFALVYIPKSSSLIVYDHRSLVNIGDKVAHLILDTFKPDPSWPPEILRGAENNKGRAAHPRRGTKKRRGKRTGIRNRLRQQAHRASLPSILLANIQSMENKLDDLRARVTFQCDMRDYNILCFTETWLTPTVSDQAVTVLDSFFVLRTDRTAESNKTKGGGVCFMVNRKSCDARSISALCSGCLPHLEFLSIKCRPFCLPRKFTSVIATVVYIPAQADTGMALSELHDELSSLQNKDPGAALIVAGDFNKANLRQVIPNFYQHVSCPLRGDRILDHCYTPYKQGYKAVSHPAFGKSDHNAIFLIPQYKQNIWREEVTKREVKRWTAQSEATLQDALNDVDWDMFRACAVNINEFTEVAVCFVNMLAEEIIPTARVTTFPNQKPWMDRSSRTAVNARTPTYNAGLATGDMSTYKAASYGVRHAVRDAKRLYRELYSKPRDKGLVRTGLI
ncbi:uncharacterized protein LOC120725650 [Simochromis diagramma]|uniref:uncharacterized protein LOC120725650 n=1 Tax=Simochromis diagramma TaxID=43689 RepID=UPI001A7ED478|nr:uncharacterized protein LOC120725650 [Simochromis diagramma]